MRRISTRAAYCLIPAVTAVLSGCGSESGTPADAAASKIAMDGRPSVAPAPPTAAITAAQPASATTPPATSAAGSPEWLLAEIKRLRLEPAPESNDAEPHRDAVRRRNQRIIELSEQAIAKTHGRPDLAELFNAAVHHLLEARVQLALSGDRDSIVSLYDDAAALIERDGSSRAALEASFKLVEFSREMARRHAGDEPRWVSEFARQARLFATTHSDEQERAAAQLDSAGWSCESHALLDEARGCYQLLETRFPESPQAALATAILRRLNLPGGPLQLAGPTFDGGYIDIERDFAGKVVLVLFWDTAAAGVEQQLPLLADLYRAHHARGLEIVGVNLDDDARAVESALESGRFAWPTIFFVHQKQRRWNNPIVSYYGVRDIPSAWLVGRDGRVVATHVDPANLAAQIESLLGDSVSNLR